MKSSVYLSGPPNDYVDPEFSISTDWKAYAISSFLRSGITVANPIELDLSGCGEIDFDPTSPVKHSLSLIDKSDSLLANLLRLSQSSTMEVFYAYRQGKQVVVVGNEPFSPWVLNHSDVRFHNLKEAIDYIVSMPYRLDTIAWSTQFEAELKKKSEQYPPDGRVDYEFYGGNNPILVLAPHATNYFREGSLHSQESYTGTFAVLLHKLTGCHSLISSYCMAADPVYYLNSPFVNFLSDLLNKMKVKLVISLHGIEDWNNNNELILTSWNKSSLIDKTEYLNLLINMLQVKDFKDVGFDMSEDSFKDKKSINHLLFEDLTIPTIRLEIHKRFRLPQLQRSLYTRFYTSLAQFISVVGSG